MPKKRITVTLREEQVDMIDEMENSDDPRYDSRSEVVRYLIDRVEELEADVEELERNLDRVRNEKEVLVEQHQQSKELEVYREQQETLLEASLGQRVKWLVFGRDGE